MKCPKCHYLSFEPEPRCRNCGYDLTVPPGPELELRSDEPDEGALMELALRSEEDAERAEPKVVTLGPIDLDQVVGAPETSGPVPADNGNRNGTGAKPAKPVSDAPPLRVVPAPERPARKEPVARRTASRPKAPSTTAELPLFVKSRPAGDEDEPLVKMPATPAVPLAVRRTQEVARPKPAPRVQGRERDLGPLERDLLGDLRRLEERVAERARVQEQQRPADEPRVVVRRLVAAAIDATLLGTISAGVLWGTLRLCDLGLGEAATLPIVPLAAFLLLVAAGYLLMFTVAGGQTVGKMLTGLRVVGTDDVAPGPGRVTPGQAALRALLTVPSVLMLGLGFLPALGGHGAVHDRLSHTRVVLA